MFDKSRGKENKKKEGQDIQDLLKLLRQGTIIDSPISGKYLSFPKEEEYKAAVAALTKLGYEKGFDFNPDNNSQTIRIGRRIWIDGGDQVQTSGPTPKAGLR